eukprot:811862_1
MMKHVSRSSRVSPWASHTRSFSWFQESPSNVFSAPRAPLTSRNTVVNLVPQQKAYVVERLGRFTKVLARDQFWESRSSVDQEANIAHSCNSAIVQELRDVYCKMNCLQLSSNAANKSIMHLGAS